jgi:putative ABC transport system permease protein
MSAISLTPLDLAIAASLVALDAVLSLILALRLHRQIVVAATRMVLQLIAIGYILRLVFKLNNPMATLAIVVVMALIAGREVAARPEQRFKDLSNLALGAGSVALATFVTVALALTTAIRPQPWFDPRYAIPLAGIILGNVLSAASLTLDSLLSATVQERTAIEARLCLGSTYWQAVSGPIRSAIRRGLLPIINQMSAAGVVTLPGIMTGQILAGMDPLEAVKYQILLMFLLSGGSGLAAVAIAYLTAWRLTDPRQRLRLDRLRPVR